MFCYGGERAEGRKLKAERSEVRSQKSEVRVSQRITRNPQPATCNLQPAPRNPQPATWNPQHTFFTVPLIIKVFQGETILSVTVNVVNSFNLLLKLRVAFNNSTKSLVLLKPRPRPLKAFAFEAL